jgi:hypothetical protein
MKWFMWFLIIIVLGVAIWALFSREREAVAPTQSDAVALEQEQGKEQQDIREQVTEFGNILKNVSLLAPTAAADIERDYAPYVTRSLRAAWAGNPESALGRETSSPWPERIEVIDIEPSNDTYQVRGMVVYMTSEEIATGGDAGSTEMVFIMRTEDGTWKIDSATVVRRLDPNAPRSEGDKPKLE